MPDPFDRLIEPLLAREGGYSNHPLDRGGETNHGITVAVARANGYRGPMQDMTKAQAKDIYRKRYWSGPGFDRIAALSVPVAEELFDTGVNMGPAVGSMFLQRALNGLNRQGADYADLLADGDIGPATLAALRAYLRKRGPEGEEVLLRALNVLQGARYIELAEKRTANEAFLYGWLRTRVA